jgi:hypothetical protein
MLQRADHRFAGGKHAHSRTCGSRAWSKFATGAGVSDPLLPTQSDFILREQRRGAPQRLLLRLERLARDGHRCRGAAKGQHACDHERGVKAAAQLHDIARNNRPQHPEGIAAQYHDARHLADIGGVSDKR